MAASLFGTGGTVNVNVNGTLVPQSFTATAGQVLFTISGFTYSPGTNSLLVFINGQRQVLGRDFTETSGSSFTLVEGALAGDYVDIIGFPQTTLTAVTPGVILLGGTYYLSNLLTDSIVNVKQYPYLAKGDGTTDDTAAINAALAASKLVYIPPGTYKTSSALNVSQSGSLVYGSGRGSTIISCTSGSVNQFNVTGALSVIRDLSITVTASGIVGAIAAVNLNGANNCIVNNVEVYGVYYSGFLINNAAYNIISNCYTHGFLGANQDAASISVYGTSVGNVVADNHLYGGCEHGVLVQDPYAGTLPQKNIIRNNRIGQHTAYGIVVYIPGPGGVGDSYNQIIGNYVENIQGSFATNRDSGAGIYIVGNWAGGTQVIGNTVYNCCVQTLTRNLAPAGIGINGIPVGVAKPVISNNTITGMTQGEGILITASPGGADLTGNVISIPATNMGTGVGGATLSGSGIRLENSNDCTLTGGNVTVAGNGAALIIYANGINLLNPTIIGGEFATSGTTAAVYTAQVGGCTINGLSITGARAKTSNAATYVLQLSNINGSIISGVTAIAAGGTGAALSLITCTQTRVSGGSFTGSAVANLNSAGVCTGSFIDKTNYLGVSNALIINAGTGLSIEQRQNVIPTAGTWAIGDGVQQSVPVVAQPKGWRCTVAGSPGTWVSEGNL